MTQATWYSNCLTLCANTITGVRTKQCLIRRCGTGVHEVSTNQTTKILLKLHKRLQPRKVASFIRLLDTLCVQQLTSRIAGRQLGHSVET